MYDDSELLERYRFNRTKILYIIDLLHRDLCPLTGMSQSIDVVTKVLLTPRYFVHHRSRETISNVIYYIFSSANHRGYPMYNKNRMGFS